MRKKILSLLLAASLLGGGMGMTAHAENHKGPDSWAVTFNGSAMESNFKGSDLVQEAYQLQPGDTVQLSVAVKNGGGKASDWYMKNEILASLEESQSVAEGGSYTYLLSYVDKAGTETILYNSSSVGGEGIYNGKEGLAQATDSLENYFFLDTLQPGEAGSVHLTVGLDGETQGNAYQDTLARLAMQFAVEDGVSTTNRGSTPQTGDPLRSGVNRRNMPQTGDETDLLPYILAAAGSGCVLLLIGALWMRKDDRDDEESEVRA